MREEKKPEYQLDLGQARFQAGNYSAAPHGILLGWGKAVLISAIEYYVVLA